MLPTAFNTSPKNAFMLGALLLLGFLGNYFALPLFFGADFLFGSAFVLLILYLFGLRFGLIAAVLVNSYTYILWGHPYGFFIFTLEILFVGYFLKDRRRNILLLDGLYWLFVGIPLNGLIYLVLLHMDSTTSAFIVLKQGINGISNALLVSLAITYLPFYRLPGRAHERRTVSIQETTFNLLVALVLIPSLFFTIIQIRNEMKQIENSAITELQMLSENIQLHLTPWFQKNLTPIKELAQLASTAATSSAGGLQRDTEILKKSFPDFHTIHIENAVGTTIACSPSSNERGSTIGVNMADRDWFIDVSSTIKPTVSGVFLGSRLTISPTVILSVPILRGDQFWGAATGALDVQQLNKFLEAYNKNKNVTITLTDTSDRVIASTAKERASVQEWEWNKNGTISHVISSVYRWSPLEKNLPSMIRWKKSFFVQENRIDTDIPWMLIVESPIAPLQQRLYAMYVQDLSILAGLVMLTLLLALVLSRWLAKPLANLAAFSSRLPDKITSQKVIEWPESETTEVASLIGNFQTMTQALEQSFQDIQDKANALNMTLNATADGILAVDAAGKIIFYNQQFAKLWEIPHYILDTGDDKKLLDHVLDQLSDPDGFVNEVIRLYHSDESSFDVIHFKDGRAFERYSFPLQQGDSPSNGRVWSFRNITERLQQETILRNSEYEFHMLTEAMPQIVWICSPDGMNIYFNQQWVDYSGLTSEESLGHGWKRTFHPDDLQKAKLAWQNSRYSGDHYTFECRLRRLDGVYRWWLVRGVPVRDEQGVIIKWFGTCTDIEELKQSEVQLSQSKAVAESASRAKSDFLANMSHEIRTPMNGVLGMTQLLEMTDLTQEQQEYVEALKLSGNNLLSLISDILDLSKIEAGKLSVQMAEFSLEQCINDIVMMQKQAAHEKGLALYVDPVVNVPHILIGDQLRIKQILINLVANAVKFTAKGGVTITMQLMEQHDSSVLVQICVQDTGIGIAPEALDAIFMPFTQEDGSTTRTYGGTGLGLTISRRLAEIMGGNITVVSTVGAGSCFTVMLPFSVGKVASGLQAVPAQEVIGWDGPRLRILFVEDDPINITFGTSLLKKLGHDFITVKNGSECLVALEKSSFDLVLMDIQMPIMNGEEALREIRTKERGSDCHQPVIALTAYSMRGDKERFLMEGFDGYVSKPLSTNELISEVKRVMDSRN